MSQKKEKYKWNTKHLASVLYSIFISPFSVTYDLIFHEIHYNILWGGMKSKKSQYSYILIRNTGSIELTDYTQVFINPLSHFSVPSPDHSLPLSSTGSVHR